MMKRIMSLMLALVLTFNLIQVSSVSYATELNEINKAENSAAEAADDDAASSGLTNDMSISGTNSIGTMLQSELTDVAEEQEQNNGYNVFAIEVEGTTAKVEYEAVEDCQLLVSIYDNEGIQMLGSGEVDVSATETEATVTIDIDSMPEYFYIRAYLIENDTLVPLCQEYNSELYTQTMQEFLAKTPEDFDSEKVLEIEEESNSFVVFGEATQIIPYNAGYNTIEKMDEANREYVIANPDENFNALQPGDIFSYEYEDGQVLIVDVATIEAQEGKLVITGNEADMNEVFDYVRIDTDFSTADSTVDPSTCDEDVTYLGRTNADEETTIASVEASKTNTAAGGYGVSNAGKKISSSDEVEVEDTYEVGKKDSNGNPKGFYGSVEFKATGVLKVYRATGAEYIELSLTITINGTVQFTEKIDKSLKLGCLGFSPTAGVYIEIVPQIQFKAEAALKYEAKAEFVIGVRGDKDGIKNITKKPKIEHKLKMEGTVYIGLSLSPKLKVVNDNVFKVSLTATAGVEFQLENQDITTNEKKGIQHDCVDCLEGDVRFKLSLSASLQLFDVDWFKFTKNFAKVDKKISDMYASLSYGEFKLTKCPHLKYRITAIAIDADELPLEGVTVCDKYKTGTDGTVEFYLKRGRYQATAKKDGYIYALSGMFINNFVVKDKEQQLHFLMLPDLSTGDGGSEEDSKEDDSEEDSTESGESTKEIAIGSDIFPDANFRQYVKNEIDTDGNGKLSQTEIMDVTDIEVLNAVIFDLSGIEVFTELLVLNCEENAITSLDVSKNLKLQELFCDANNLTSLDVSKNTELQRLSCEENAITSLDVSKNTKLRYLSCYATNLTSLDVSKNVELQELSCDVNNLTSLDVSKSTKLQGLYCGGNAITSLDVSKNTELQQLNCSGNNLTSLDVSKSTKLQGLYCGGNAITSLDVSKNTELQALFCEENAITSLDVSKNTELQYLSCEGNIITSLDLTNNTKLIDLDCDDDVEVIDYNTDFASVASMNEVVKFSEPAVRTAQAVNNSVGNELPEQLQEKNWITSTATDTKNTYSGLYPDAIYNFYVFKEAPTDTPFDSVFTEDNLLYVKQYTSDANGYLTLEYAPTGDNTDAIEILVCVQKIDVADGYEVRVDNLTYNGKKQTPAVTLSVQGKTLVEGKDFNIEGDVIVSEIGDYTLTLVGIGKYTGELEVAFSVLGENAVPVTGIALEQTTLKLSVGDKVVLTADITPNDATDKTITWSSDNPKVATVDANGNVTAVAEGTANVVVTATDGSGVKAQCVVTVTKKQTTTEQPTTEQPDTTKKLPKVGTKKTISDAQYKVTKSTSKTKEVTFVKPKSSKKTSVTIPATVKIDGYTYKVTAIADKAFKNNKKIKSVTVGKNVKKIGKQAFYNCKKLKKITIKSAVLKSVGKNAIKNIDKKATIKVPKSKLKKYKNLFKSKTGYKKTMKIKK